MNDHYDAETIAAFAVASAPGVGPAVFHRIREVNALAGRGFAGFLRLDRRLLTCEYRLTAMQIQALAETGPLTAIAKALEAARREGVRLVMRAAPEYPPRLIEMLGAGAPSYLFVRGPVSLCSAPCAAVIGTRSPSRWGISGARGLGEACARRGWVLVSGYASGIDQSAHRAAAVAGGRTVLVLCYGMSRYLPMAEIAVAEREGRAAVISQFPLHQTFMTATAMARNRVVAALAGRVAAAETRRRGGTMETARMARELHRPVFALRREAWERTPDGNRLLIEKGARALMVRQTDQGLQIESDDFFAAEALAADRGQMELPFRGAAL